MTQVFQQFRLGLAFFFVGGVLIWQSQQISPSLAEELLFLAGIVIGGVGFIVAMMAQIRHIIGHFLRFWQDQ